MASRGFHLCLFGLSILSLIILPRNLTCFPKRTWRKGVCLRMRPLPHSLGLSFLHPLVPDSSSFCCFVLWVQTNRQADRQTDVSFLSFLLSSFFMIKRLLFYLSYWQEFARRAKAKLPAYWSVTQLLSLPVSQALRRSRTDTSTRVI